MIVLNEEFSEAVLLKASIWQENNVQVISRRVVGCLPIFKAKLDLCDENKKKYAI